MTNLLFFWFDTGVAHTGKRCSEHELAVGWNNKGQEFCIFHWIEKKIICLPVINCERIISGGYSALVATKTSEFIVFFSCARRVKVGGWHEYISGGSRVVPCCLRKRGAGGSRSGIRDCERLASITLTLDYTPFLDELCSYGLPSYVYKRSSSHSVSSLWNAPGCSEGWANIG